MEEPLINNNEITSTKIKRSTVLISFEESKCLQDQHFENIEKGNTRCYCGSKILYMRNNGYLTKNPVDVMCKIGICICHTRICSNTMQPIFKCNKSNKSV